MIKRYPCQAAVLLVLGILTAKGLPPGRQQEILLAAPASAAAALLLASWALREKAALKSCARPCCLGLYLPQAWRGCMPQHGKRSARRTAFSMARQLRCRAGLQIKN